MGRGSIFLACAVVSATIVASGPATAETGCAGPAPGGEWRSYGHDLSNTRSQPDESTIGPAEAAGLSSTWVFSTASAGGAGGQIDSTPIVADGCVYVGTSTGEVFAINADDGQLVWRTDLAAATGKEGGIVGAVAVSGGRVLGIQNRPNDPSAFALDQATGEVLWSRSAGVEEDGMRTNASAVVFDGMLFVGISGPERDFKRGGFALFDAATGELLNVTRTISDADLANGYAGGGMWATAVVDPVNRYAYAGTSNPYTQQKEHRHSNAILKMDIDRQRPTFGQIVDAYKGTTDQYFPGLERQPACENFAEVTYFASYSATCAQGDHDFGASPNMFIGPDGDLLVGELQKSGVYHVVYADTMQSAWTTVVAGFCVLCNAGSTATDGSAIYGIGGPDGHAFSVDMRGALRWLTPEGSGLHFEATSVANGVVYTVDVRGSLEAWDAATGVPMLHRPVLLDAGAPAVALSSSGVSIARNAVYVAAAGFVVAYRVA